MTAAIAPITALLLSVAFLLMGNGLQGTLLPVRAGMESFGSVNIGILGASYFLGFAAGCFFGPHVVRRVGHIRVFTAMVAIASCVVLLHSLALQPTLWWVLRAGTGFCFAVLYMVIESWLNEKTTNESRGLVFSVYTIINLTVITIGQLMLILDDPTDFPLFALASILVSLAAVPVAMTKAPAPEPIAAVKIRLPYLFALSPVAVIGCLAVGLANGAFWALAPIFAQKNGGTTTDVALFMSIAVVGGAIGQWPLGRLSDRTDRRKIIIFACIGGALAGLGATFGASLWADSTLIFAFMYGFFAMPLYAISVAHMNDFVERDGYVEAAGGLLLVFALGAIIGPIAASLTTSQVGMEYLFSYTAVIHILTAVFAVYRMQKRHHLADDDQVPFADSLRVAQTVSTVNPLPEINETQAPEKDET